MLQSAYLVIDPQTQELVDTLVVPWSFSDAAALKDMTKAYILIALRDSRAEAFYECEKWKQIYLKDLSQVPKTIGKVWAEYFKYCKEFEGLTLANRIPKTEKKIIARPASDLPLWSTLVTCERCKQRVRLGVYNTKHADGKCKNKKRWYTLADLERLKLGLPLF